MLYNAEWPGRSRVTPPSFHDELTMIWQDPPIWRLALRRAGSSDLAEDALQETYYSVARVKDPAHIENLRAFFCWAPINQISHLRGQLNPIPVDDPEMLVGTQRQGGRVHAAAARPVDEAAVWVQLAATWRKRFRREHEAAHGDGARALELTPGATGR